jgi:hypothetical protein
MGGLVPIDLRHIASELRELKQRAASLQKEIDRGSRSGTSVSWARNSVADSVRHILHAIGAPDEIHHFNIGAKARSALQSIHTLVDEWFSVRSRNRQARYGVGNYAFFRWEVDDDPDMEFDSGELPFILRQLESHAAMLDANAGGPVNLAAIFPMFRDAQAVIENAKAGNLTPEAEAYVELAEKVAAGDKPSPSTADERSDLMADVPEQILTRLSPLQRAIFECLWCSRMVTVDDLIREAWKGEPQDPRYVGKAVGKLKDACSVMAGHGIEFLKQLEIDTGTGGVFSLAHPAKRRPGSTASMNGSEP